MKKVTLFAAMAALVFVSCNKDENLQLEMSNHTITASMETDSPETRTAFDRESGALYWIAGDDIAVLNTNGSFTQYTLTSGAGTANATFTAKAKIGANSTYALHPYSEHKYENEALTFNLPDSYIYGETEKGNQYGAAPMIAQTDEVDASNFYFEHLGGAFCFTINNLPANTTYFKFEADEQITGDFAVTTDNDGKNIISLPTAQVASVTQLPSASSYAVTINFPAENEATNKKFFIPLPVGSIEGFTISVGTTEETWSYTSTKTNTITRRKLLAMPEVTLNASVDGTVATEISTLDQLKSAFTNGGTYTLSDNINNVNETLVLPAGKSLILNLGDYTLTSTVAYSSDSKAIVNNGKLTITSGSEGGIVTETRGVYNVAGSEAILNCNITSNKSNAVCNYFASKLTINGGNYESKLENGNQGGVAVRMGDNATDNAWILEINGGTFKAPYTALHLINNYYGLGTAAGSAQINGGTFEGGTADIGGAAIKNITISKACNLDVIKNLASNPASYSCEITGTVMCDMRDGENHYDEIFAENTQKAIASVFTNGGTITLTENATISETLTVAQGKTVVLNLGNYTLTSNVAYSSDSKAIVNNGKLTITSGSEGGIVTETRGVYNVAGSEAILNCNITSNKSNAVCNYFASKLTINGGNYESKLENGNQGGVAVRMGDNATDNAWILEINGGTFKAPYTALHLINNYYGLGTAAGSAQINGGTFEGGTADIGGAAIKNITISKACNLDVIKNLASNPASFDCIMNNYKIIDSDNHYTEVMANAN